MLALVTGGAGLIGSHLVDLLLERGHRVRILDSLDSVTHPSGKPPPWVPADAEFVHSDVRYLMAGRDPMVDCDVVFHLAAFGGFAPDAASLMMETNAFGTVRVMEAARRAGVGKVVVASSQAVYGYGIGLSPQEVSPRPGWSARRAPERLADAEWEPTTPAGNRIVVHAMREKDPVDLPTPYALSKYAGERAALMLGDDWGLPTVALRFALTYGPRQSVSNPYTGICSIFATKLAAGRAPVIFEDGSQTRDFTYVEDVARALLHVAGDDRANGQALNVGTGVATTVMDFARLLQGELGGPDPRCSGEYRPGDARHVVCDASRLRDLGWSPRVPVAEGVARYAEWFRESAWGAAVPDVGNELRDGGVVRSVHA